MYLKLVFSFLLAFVANASEKKETFIYNVGPQTTYEDICVLYDRLVIERDSDSCLLLKTSHTPLLAIYANIFSNWSHRWMLYLRNDKSVLCWYDNDATTPLIYNGSYHPEEIAGRIKESVINKGVDKSDAIEFVVQPECFKTPITRHIELLYLLSTMFNERTVYIHIKSYPEKL